MKHQTALRWIIPLIGLLALFAASMGLFWSSPGTPTSFTTLRGESVSLVGHGLYRHDTVSSAAQEQAQDAVTLLVGLPLLVTAAWLAFGGSLRGQLLLTGTLGYFLYTYTSMAFGTAYNALFLVYVALFSLSLWAFVLSMLSIDLAGLPQRFSPQLPRRGIAGLLFGIGGFLLVAWLGRIVPALLRDQPPIGLESSTTLFIQVLDLAVIVPLAFVSGVLLLRRNAWGYLLASVFVMKIVTMGLAVSAMGINMLRIGATTSAVELVIFPALTLINLVAAGLLLKHVEEPRPATQPRRVPLAKSPSP